MPGPMGGTGKKSLEKAKDFKGTTKKLIKTPAIFLHAGVF